MAVMGQLRVIDEGRGGLCNGYILAFRPVQSLDLPGPDIESWLYVLSVALTRGLELLDEQPYRRIPVDELQLSCNGERLDSHPEIWAELWRCVDES